MQRRERKREYAYTKKRRLLFGHLNAFAIKNLRAFDAADPPNGSV
jgi:hypothetical protein